MIGDYLITVSFLYQYALYLSRIHAMCSCQFDQSRSRVYPKWAACHWPRTGMR